MDDPSLPQWRRDLSQCRDWLTGLLSEYVGFFALIIRPGSVVSFGVGLAALAYAQDQAGTTRLLLEAVVAVAGGVFGGLVVDGFNRMSGNGFLVKKSASAIRNLQLIKNKVVNVSLRIEAVRRAETARDWDEVTNLVDNIGADIINAISDWNDVNPTSAAVAGVMEYIAAGEKAAEVLRREIRAAQADKERAIAEQLTSAEELAKTDESLRNLRAKLTKVENETAKLRQQSSQMITFGPSLTASSGLDRLGIALTNSRVDLTTPYCSNCGAFHARGECPQSVPST